MAQTTVNTVFSQVTKSLPIGQLESIESAKVNAASFYQSSKNTQTLTWDVSTDFIGSIKVYATLFDEPNNDQWFEIYEIDHNLVKTGYHNVMGNFVWIHAKITDWVQGIVRTLTVNY